MDLKVVPVTVRAQAADKLREAIISGHFRPGQRLVETEMCQVLGIGRGSVREALRQLEGERLVTISPNRGPSVATLSWNEAAQIYAIRVLLEGEAAALAANTATSHQRTAMAAALDAFDAAAQADDALAQVATTSQFYAALLQACGNEIIGEVLLGLHARINLLRSRSMSRAGRSLESSREMRSILDAILGRKPAKARAAAAAHVTAACEAARLMMQEVEAA